jgi:hypothetical protein
VKTAAMNQIQTAALVTVMEATDFGHRDDRSAAAGWIGLTLSSDRALQRHLDLIGVHGSEEFRSLLEQKHPHMLRYTHY